MLGYNKIKNQPLPLSINDSICPNLPRWQGPMVLRSEDPQFPSSQALELFCSSQNSLNSNLTLKKLLLTRLFFKRRDHQSTSACRLEVMKQKCLKKDCFLTLWIRITNGLNREWGGVGVGTKCFIQNSHEAKFRTLYDTWGGLVQNALFKIAAKQSLRLLMILDFYANLWRGWGDQITLFKIAAKQCLRLLMMLDFDTWFCRLILMLDFDT